MRLLSRVGVALSLTAVPVVLAASTFGASNEAGVPTAVPTAAPKAVGALFSLGSDGKLGTHFCTATVVQSPRVNVVITAAHCLLGQTPGSFAFVPGYHNGAAPLGIWVVTKAYVDRAWTSSADADHDVAFLVVSKPGARSRLVALTGGERLGAARSVGKKATAVGYPGTADAAIACTNSLLEVSATQMRFDCDGYTDGTSGSALVVDRDPVTGLGAVVGVIGGYEEGGYTPFISYAAAFDSDTKGLYRAAIGAEH
jgi:V8-like Glu-specific endopeptidase